MGTETSPHHGLKLAHSKESGWECDHCKSFPNTPTTKIELTRKTDHVIFDGQIRICAACAGSLGSALTNLSKLYA